LSILLTEVHETLNQTSHHIQIYFYTLCLNYLFEHDSFHSAESAGVWLPPKDGFHHVSPSLEDIKSIAIPLLAPALDAFLFRALPKVISLHHDDVKWHYNPLCHGCRYEPDCKSRALEDGEIGSMPNISIDDARALKDLLRMSKDKPKHLTDIEDLHGLVASPARLSKVAKSSPSLIKKARQVLALPKKTRSEIMQSPMVESSRTKQVHVSPATAVR